MELFKLIGKIVIEGDEAQDEIDATKKKASDAGDGISGAFKKIGGAIAAYLTVDAIKNFGAGCINAAADANAAASQFSQVFGDLESKAGSSLSKIANDAGISENRVKGSFTQIAAFAKTTGMDTETALGLSERALVAVADSAAFYDRSLEDTTESLQSFLKGNFENDAALGLSCTETTRNAAANELYGKSFQELSEKQKQLTLLKMVEDANKASGALGQAARESDTWGNVTGNLKQAWTDFQATLGQNILPTAVNVVKSLADKVAVLAEKVPVVVQWFKEHQTTLANVAVAIGVVAAGITAYNVVQAVNLAMEAAEVTTLGALIAAKLSAAAATMALYAPYILIAAAIAAVIAIGVALYKNWDTIKAKCVELANNLKQKFTEMKEAVAEKIEAMKQAVTEKFNAIKDTIGNVMQAAKDTVSEKLNNMKNAYQEHGGGIKGIAAAAIEGVKGYYTAGFTFINNLTGGKLGEIANKFKSKMNEAKDAVKNAISKIKGFFDFKWSLPRPKLPKFSVSGGKAPWGFMGQGSLPKIGISWYKKAYDNAMLLNNPAIFGYSPASGNFLGGGEGNGSEVVAGSQTLRHMIQGAVATQNEALVYYLQKVIEILAAFFPQVLECMDRDIVLESGVLVGELAVPMDQALGRLKNRKDRGR